MTQNSKSYVGSRVVSRVKEELAAEWKKDPVARVMRLCSIGTSEKVRVLTMLPEASFMFTVTDIYCEASDSRQLTSKMISWNELRFISLKTNSVRYW